MPDRTETERSPFEPILFLGPKVGLAAEVGGAPGHPKQMMLGLFPALAAARAAEDLLSPTFPGLFIQ